MDEIHDALLPESALVPIGYDATETDDALIVHRIPIFVECERGEVNFDAAWIGNAVRKAMKRQQGGYMPPMHVRHHEDDVDPRPAGYFKILGTEVISFEGKPRTAVIADLIITDPFTRGEFKAKRLPYRSVEIFNVEKPGFDSLALLDHEAPFLELPMGFIARTKDDTTVANATFAMQRRFDDGPMVACFRNGPGAHLLFKDSNMTTKHETRKEQDAKAVSMADDGPKKDGDKDDGEGEDMAEDGKLDVSTVVKAIESGEISIADMTAIMDAINAANAAPDEEPEPEQAPAPAPGAEAMKSNQANAAKFASQQAVIDGLLDREKTRNTDDKRKTDVDAAFSRLKDRPLGANLRKQLDEFHAKFGAEAFAEHVETLATTFGPMPATGGDPVDFRADEAGASTVVMKYQDKGSDAVEQATKFSRIWRDLHTRGLCRQTEERYVEVNMSAASMIKVAN